MTSRTEGRGLALPLVLAAVVILFLVGGSVAALSVQNARMAASLKQRSEAHQQVQAALAEVRTRLDDSTDWATTSLARSRASIEPGARAWYDVAVVPGAARKDSVTVDVTGYLEDESGNRLQAMTVRATFRRAGTPFRYPVQVADNISITSGSVTAPDGFVALRSNAIASGALKLVSGLIRGDLVVGSTSAPQSVVSKDGGSTAGNITSSEIPALMPPVQQSTALLDALPTRGDFTREPAPPEPPAPIASSPPQGAGTPWYSNPSPTDSGTAPGSPSGVLGSRNSTSVSVGLGGVDVSVGRVNIKVGWGGISLGGPSKSGGISSGLEAIWDGARSAFSGAVDVAVGTVKAGVTIDGKVTEGERKTVGDAVGGLIDTGLDILEQALRDSARLIFGSLFGKGGSRTAGGSNAGGDGSYQRPPQNAPVPQPQPPAPDRVAPPPAPQQGPVASTGGGNVTLEGARYGKVVVTDGSSVTLNGGTYVFGDVTLTNGSSIKRSPSATERTVVYISGDLRVEGGAIENPDNAGDLIILGTRDGATYLIKGHVGDLKAALYAPGAQLTLQQSKMSGSVVTAGLTADQSDIEYDENLRPVSVDGVGTATLVSWEKR